LQAGFETLKKSAETPYQRPQAKTLQGKIDRTLVSPLKVPLIRGI
jgi:hypothetical protein